MKLRTASQCVYNATECVFLCNVYSLFTSHIPGNITKKLPRRTVVPVSDTVIFCVELEHPFPDVYWTRNGEKLKEDSRISIGCVLRQYTLTIRDCQADDSGEVAFVAGDCKTSTRFSVTGEDDTRVKFRFIVFVLTYLCRMA